jgi:hypothetical protein
MKCIEVGLVSFYRQSNKNAADLQGSYPQRRL